MNRIKIKLRTRAFAPTRAYDLLHYEVLQTRRERVPLTAQQLAKLHLKEI